MTALLFFYFAAGIIGSSLMVVLLRNPIYCTLALLVMFAHVAGLFVLLNAEFIAAVQVVVYAGAILVLYLFVVMLLNVKREERFQRQAVPALIVAALLLSEAAVVFFGMHAAGATVGGVGEASGALSVGRIQASGNTAAIGQVLYSTYLYPFEIASLLLLAAMVGAIVLSKKVS
ncbi:MAG TPA: NADH-quinone oxidoreductase subunit J [Nitrospiria bacterium]|nr:NADH-quinone oxidoreductase subunit J [Nitrospiria bacterium]